MNIEQKFPQLAGRLFNVPLALLPARAEGLIAGLAMSMPYGEPENNQRKAYAVAPPGIAIIPVQGLLMQKLGSCYSWGWMTGYDGIMANLADALNDDSIKAVVLDIDSPGGECAGCFDLADMIFAARGTKPLWAILNENAFSSAYAIASACDKVSVPRTGGTGSIGVILLLADITGALDQAGVKVNVIQFGAYKTDGQPVVELNDAARARFQAQIDVVGNLFVETVARNRRIPAGAVEAQQAGMFMGQDGVRNGLADMVAAPHEAFAQLLATIK